MNTENPVYNAGRIAYDADCAVCRSWVWRLGGLAVRHGFSFVPLQDAAVAHEIRRAGRDPLAELHLLLPNGRIIGGADALLAIARGLPLTRPLSWLAALPGFRPLSRKLYRWLAARRHCLGRSCALPNRAGGRRHSVFFDGP